jgi:hypothetical protein
MKPNKTFLLAFGLFVLLTFILQGNALAQDETIFGIVKDKTGTNPIQSIVVLVWNDRGNPVSFNGKPAATTGPDGVFSFNLPPGRYQIQFNPWPAGFPGTPPYYSPEWYDHKFIRSQGNWLNVISGQGPYEINPRLENGGWVSGYLKDPNNNSLQNYDVFFTSPVSNVAAGGRTDMNGFFSFYAPAGNNYTLSFAPTCNVNANYFEKRFSGINLAEGQHLENVYHLDSLGGKFYGKVTSLAEPDGVSSFSVSTQDADHIGTGTYMSTGGLPVGSGNYCLFVPAGNYKLYFAPMNQYPYFPEYFPHKIDWYNAASIPIQANQSINIDTEFYPGGQIRGTVTGPDGQPRSGISIRAADPISRNWLYFGNTFPDGTYRMNVAPGKSYKILFNNYQFILPNQPYYEKENLAAEWYNHLGNVYNMDDAEIIPASNTPIQPNQIIENIDASLDVGGKIEGRVFAPDGVTGLKDVWVRVYASDQATSNSVYLGQTRDEGYFTVWSLGTGSYNLQIDPTAAYPQYPTQSYLNNPIQVTAGQTTSDVNITIRTQGTITAIIKNTDNPSRGIANVNVIAINYQTGAYVNGGWTDSNGLTSFIVPEGSYRVYYSTYSSEGYYLSKYYNNGFPFLLSGGGIKNITDTLTKGIQVSVDIKPGLNPNMIKICEENLTAAILSSNDLNPSKVNPSTVSLLGIPPSTSAWQDVNNDGKLDLVMTFPASGLNLIPSPSSTVLTLNANIEDRGAAISVTGSDYIFTYDTINPPTVFEDFSLGTIDTSKWFFTTPIQSPPPVVSGGKLVIENSLTNSPSSRISGVYIKNSTGINSIKAKVKISEFNNPNGALPNAEIAGFFYNDKYSTPNYSSGFGNMWVQLSMGGRGSSPTAYWAISRANANYTQYELVHWGSIIPVTINEGEYTLSIGLNGSELIFSVDGEEFRHSITGNIYSPSFSGKYFRTSIAPPIPPQGSPIPPYSASIKASFDDIEVPAMADYTPACANNPVQVQPLDTTTGLNPVTVIYDQVSQCGVTTLSTSSTPPSPPPSGFQMGDPPTYYDLSTTAVVSGPRTVCINYSGITYTDEFQLRLLHYENGGWTDITKTNGLDMINNIICGESSSFSPFAIMKDLRKVWVDIKPGSDINSINLDSQGLTPVAILSTPDFDVRTITLSTIRFAGISPTKSKLEDVNKDGRLDLMLFFVTDELDLAIGSTEATLSGGLENGTIIWGSDMVRIVPQKK